MDKILVTGATGFLGRYVLDLCQREKIQIVAIGRRSQIGREGVEVVQADLLEVSDFDALIESLGATHLLHLAWYAEHGKYWASPLNLRWVETTMRLVEAFCKNGGRRVVAAGTCAEYDWSHGYCREDSTPADPASLYGIAKDAARRLVMGICRSYNVSYAWGRVFFPYGPGEASGRLIPSLISAFQGKSAPFGVNAIAYRDFLHASDVADAFITLLRADETGIFNICSGESTQLGMIVREIATQLNADPQPVLDLSKQRKGEPRLLVGDSSRLNALGWQPKITLPSGIRNYIGEASV